MQYLLRYLGEIVHQLEYSEADIHTSLVTNISCAKKTDEDLGNHCFVCTEELGPKLFQHPSYY